MKTILNKLDGLEEEEEGKVMDEEKAWLTLTRGSVKLVHMAISSRVLMSG